MSAQSYSQTRARISKAIAEPDMFVAPPKPAEQLSILDGDAA